jgi:hypothetical protein
MTAKLITYYLPQYHPIPENDAWWGKGFTEWTNVAKARPLFKGHDQPRLPADLGFYDLRVPEVREQQAELARQYGIHGFCYYHYWFGNGKQLLQRPINEVLASGKPDFPFMLCWANETWKGVWFGKRGATLIEQTYPGQEDYIHHFDYLMQAFTDPRYITIDGKPVFHLYNPKDVSDLKLFVDTFREEAHRRGLTGLYLLASRVPENWDPTAHGFDGVVGSEFLRFRFKYAKREEYRFPRLRDAIKRYTSKNWWINDSYKIEQRARPFIIEYATAMHHFISTLQFPFDYFPCAIPDWDNSPRSGMQSLVLQHSTPALWEQHLREAVQKAQNLPPDRRIVFVKSWNEWAETNVLEPCQKWGRQYLEVVQKVVEA